jgi:hypothetical protein
VKPSYFASITDIMPQRFSGAEHYRTHQKIAGYLPKGPIQLPQLKPSNFMSILLPSEATNNNCAQVPYLFSKWRC